MDLKWTRAQYLNREVDHETYYDQFVNKAVRDTVSLCIGESRIKASTDEHFNDIPLENWDRMSFHKLRDGTVVPAILPDWCLQAVSKANGSGGYSLSDVVCIAKAAARQIRNGVT